MSTEDFSKKKYIKDEKTGEMVLSPEYTAWKEAPHANISSMVWVTKNDEFEYFIDEEGSKRPAVVETTAVGIPQATATAVGVTGGVTSSSVLSASVVDGKHFVPEGVAVEELKKFNGGKKDFARITPEAVRDLLESKNAMQIYEKFVQAVYDDKSTMGMLGKWKDQQFVSVIDVFRDEFAEKGIRVVFCKRSSDSKVGSRRWIEYIDVDFTGNSYVPQYDVSNMSGQVIKTMYTTLEFPNGVAVEELKQWKGRKRLQERIPIQVEKMLSDHDLMEEYNNMVDEFLELARGGGAGNTAWLRGNWNIEKLVALVDKYRPMFADKGIIIHISHKQEQFDKHVSYYRWLEFVDPVKQPNYVAQRSADSKPYETVFWGFKSEIEKN